MALDQATGLALHAAVVFARGVLPAVLLTSALCALARRLRLGPSLTGTLLLALLAACIVVPAVLTLPVGTWPRLQVRGAADVAATVALLAAGSAAAVRVAARLLRPHAPATSG